MPDFDELQTEYKLGLFYYNKTDKRILVPKRDEGLGWTLNFGNGWSYVVVFILIAGSAFVIYLAAAAKK